MQSGQQSFNYKNDIYNTMGQFKQETMNLLKEQSHKLKVLNAELSSNEEQLRLKDQQIKFFKESIMQLENENEALEKEKNEMKEKLEQIVEEIKNYNEQIVRPICVEREELRKEVKVFKVSVQESESEVKELKMQLHEKDRLTLNLQKQFQKSNKMLKQSQIKCLQLQQILSKVQDKSQKLTQEILRLTKGLNEEASMKEKLSVELGTANKQLNSVIEKYNQAVKDYELKIKDILMKKVDKSEVSTFQQILKSKEKEISQLKAQNALVHQRSEEYRHRSLSERQKMSKQFTKLRLDSEQVKMDLINLRKSITMERKVIEFESQQSDLFYSLYNDYEILQSVKEELEQKLQQHQSTISVLNMSIQSLSQSKNNYEIEQTLIKTHFQELLERLESQYEAKLLSLNLKIRHEEQALERIKKDELLMAQSNESLQNKLQSVTAEFVSYKATTEQSLNKLNQQNYRIVQEMQQLYQICEQNLNNKSSCDKLKHIIHSLLIAVHFLHTKSLESHQKQSQIYLPFVDSFLTLRKLINQNGNLSQSQNNSFSFVNLKDNQKQKKQSSNISRIKKSVYAVIAIIRMTKILQKKSHSKPKGQLSGISLLVIKSLETRNKIPNLVQLLQKQSEVYDKFSEIQQTIVQLLKVTDKAFTWPQNNVQKLEIHTSKYASVLEEMTKKCANIESIKS